MLHDKAGKCVALLDRWFMILSTGNGDARPISIKLAKTIVLFLKFGQWQVQSCEVFHRENLVKFIAIETDEGFI